MPKPSSYRLRLVIIAVLALLLAPASVAQETRGLLVVHTLRAIARDYLEPDRIEPKEMLKGALEQMERLIPELLVKYDNSRKAHVTVGIATKKFSIASVSSLSDLGRALIEILKFVDEHYAGDVEKEKIEYASIEGMLAELDPHSGFLAPKVYKEFRVGTKGEFGGLGIVISIKDGDLTVISPLEGTPAWRAGIKTGDKIIQIGDESTINMSLTDAVNKLRGKVGTKVRIVISRSGVTKPFPVTLTRAIINIDSVQKLMLVEKGKNIGYIKVKSFQANTDSDFSKALQEFHRDSKLDGLILDFRNNPGGLLNQAIDLADHFMSKGTIVKTVASRGVLMDEESAQPYDDEPGYPIIVLINGGSASASEIVAGALMASNRAIVMGQRSFGKGSVQTIFEVGGGSAIKLTIAQYLPAGTMSIQSVGVTPDVELVPRMVNREHMDLVDDVVQSEIDLEKHLERSGEKLYEPTYRASYFQPYEKVDDEMELRMREYSRVPDVKDDFAVQLAKKLLAEVTAPSRKQMLKDIKAPLAASEKEQHSIVFKHLADLGIDWSSIPKKEKSILKLAYNLRQGSRIIKSVRAGTKVDLELTATNIGQGTYAQLVAVGQSKSPLLKNREFVFGKLMPGQKRSWRVPIEFPISMPSQELTMEIDFHEEHENVPESINAIIPLRELEQPSFAFSYRLLEKSPNAKMATGKTLHLAVTAYNLGKGTSSEETVMTLSNKSGKDLFIQRGRAVLGAMKPRTSRKSTFLFKAGKNFLEPKMELELTILDPKMFAILNKKFTIDVRGGVLNPKGETRYQPPIITLSNVPPRTDQAIYDLLGSIVDTDAVRDFFIFVGDKKVVYVPNALETNSMQLNAKLPLEEGNNTIAIAARDKYELMGRRTLVIRRTSDKEAMRTVQGNTL